MYCRIKELRKAVGLTQKELAEKIGVCQAAVSVWESGEGYPEMARLQLIAAALDCSVDELFVFKREAKP